MYLTFLLSYTTLALNAPWSSSWCQIIEFSSVYIQTNFEKETSLKMSKCKPTLLYFVVGGGVFFLFCFCFCFFFCLFVLFWGWLFCFVLFWFGFFFFGGGGGGLTKALTLEYVGRDIKKYV